MRIQDVAELELDKITIVAHVDLRTKKVRIARVNGLRATEKMVDFTSTNGEFNCLRKYKEAIGKVGESYHFDNILLAYEPQHLVELLEEVSRQYMDRLNSEIVSLTDKRTTFELEMWKGANLDA